MFFWGAQILIALLAVGLSAFDFRIGIAIWFTLAIQLVALFAMLAPSNQLLYAPMVFVPMALVVGLVLELGGNRLPWWTLGTVAAATLTLVRMSLEFEAWVAGTWSSEPFFVLLWNSLIIAASLFLGFSAARGFTLTIKRRRRSSLSPS